MAPTPDVHPMRVPSRRREAARQRAIRLHPSGRARAATLPDARPDPTVQVAVVPADAARRHLVAIDESGSMTTEYGLLVVVGATICSLVIKWASGGAVFELLGDMMTAARGLIGL